MSTWKPFLGRISLFVTATPEASVLQLFKKVWNSEPDNFQKPPNPLLASSAKAKRGVLTVGCSIRPQRIDFNVTAASPRETYGLIDDAALFRSELMTIIEAIGQGEGISRSVVRVAFVVQFQMKTANIIEANKAIVSVMPSDYRLRLTDEEEFSLQVNHPRESSQVKNVRMNYLSKWSVENRKIVVVTIPGAGSPALSIHGIGPTQSNDYVVASVSFDNNNSPSDREPFTPGQQALLLSEGLYAAQAMQHNNGLNVEGF